MQVLQKRRRRCLSIALLFTLLFQSLSMPVLAATAESDFTFDKAAQTISAYIGTDLDVDIPATIEDTPVKVIGSSAFRSKKLTSVVIPEGMETLGNQSFSSNALQTLTIPNSVALIDAGAFINNTQLRSIQFGSGLKSIGDNAFFGSRSLEALALPEGLESIGIRAFTVASGSSLTSLTLPSTLKTIGQRAFEKAAITSLTIPKATEKLGFYSFASTKLTEVSVEGGADASPLVIADEVFASTPLDTISIGADRDVLVYYSVFGKNLVTDKYIDAPTILVPSGSSRTQIQAVLNERLPIYSGFSCINASDPSGNSDVRIKTPIAWNLSNVTNTASGSSYDLVGVFQSVSDETYSGTSCVSKDTVEPAMAHLIPRVTIRFSGEVSPNVWTAQDFTYDGTVITGFSESGEIKFQSNRNVTLPDHTALGDGVTGVAKNAFKDKGITQLIIPPIANGYKEYLIDTGAFQDNAIAEVTIPEGVKTINEYAFKGNQLSALQLPGTILKIGNTAFAENRITDLKISDEVKLLQIDNFAFRNNQLKTVQLPYSVFKIREYVFQNNPGMEQIPEGESGHPYGTVYLYTFNPAHLTSETYMYQSPYQRFIFESTDVQWLGEDFTYDAATITGFSASGQEKFLKSKDVVIPPTNPSGAEITAIGQSAFEMDTKDVIFSTDDVESPNGMRSVVIPSTVTRIEGSAFRYQNLQSISLPSGLTEIGAMAFNGNKLVDLVIPDLATNLGSGAFSLNALKNITLPKTLTVIPDGLFSRNYKNLTHIAIPSTVTKIGASAFIGVPLVELNLPPNLEEIGLRAFSSNRIDNELYIPGSLKTIATEAFASNQKWRHLSEVYMEEGIENIAANAFKSGTIEQTWLPSSIVSIHPKAFEDNLSKTKEHILTKLYTNNKEHLKFNDLAARSFEVIYTEDARPAPKNKPTVPTEQVTVTFDTGGGLPLPAMMTIHKGENVVAPVVSREGYRFLGWFENGSIAAFDFSKPIDSDTKLFAVWEKIEKPQDYVTVQFDANGGSAVLSQRVEKGKTAIHPFTARDGYRFLGWFESGKEAAFDFTQAIEADITLVARWERVPSVSGGGGGGTTTIIKEVPADTGIHTAYMAGYPDHSIKPELSMTRAEAVTMLAKLIANARGEAIPDAATTGFADSQTAWYTNFIAYIKDKNIISGYEDGSFLPDRQITRAEFATILTKYKNNTASSKHPFEDIAGHWAEGHISAAYQSDMVKGDVRDGRTVFRPDDEIKRVEAVVMLNKAFDRESDLANMQRFFLAPFVDLRDSSYWGYVHIMEAAVTHEFSRTESGKRPERWMKVLQYDEKNGYFTVLNPSD